MTKIEYSALVLLCTVVFSCSKPEPLATVTVSENTGLERVVAYVSAEVPRGLSSDGLGTLIAFDTEKNESVAVQIIDTLGSQGHTTLLLMFPVSIGANQTKIYHIRSSEEILDSVSALEKNPDNNQFFENKSYKATLTTENDERGGQIGGLTLKQFNDQLLQRGHIAMHWAPNFSKSNSESYFNLENLTSSSQNTVQSGIYKTIRTRSGATDSVPEIDVKGMYTFYDKLPYFIFESTMSMNHDVELNLLRNDEMTMDSLFTHVVYQAKNADPIYHELYSEDKNIFEGRPISDDVDFVAFYHKEKGYGLASIRLLYDNANTDGNPSPTYKPYTKISESRNNGRYWNRVLSDTIQKFPEGSRYLEKNAYLVFKVDELSPEKEILYYQERLLHPLEVKVE